MDRIFFSRLTTCPLKKSECWKTRHILSFKRRFGWLLKGGYRYSFGFSQGYVCRKISPKQTTGMFHLGIQTLRAGFFSPQKTTMTGWKIQHECMSRCIYFLLKNVDFTSHVMLVLFNKCIIWRTVTARCAGSDCESQLSQQPGRNDEEKHQISLES